MSYFNAEIVTSAASSRFIRALLGDLYSILNVRDCVLLQSKGSDIYRVATPNSNFIFKVYEHNSRTIRDLDFEIKSLNTLSKYKLGVVKPVACTDGDYICTVTYPEGSRYGVLYTFAAGRDVGSSNNDYYIYGRGIAKIHCVNLEQNSSLKELNITKQINDSYFCINSSIKNSKKIKDKFRVFIDTLFDRLDKLDTTGLKRGFCHGDLHGGNCSIQGSQIVFYDFEHSCYGYQAYDLATFRWGCRVLKNEKPYLQFVEGYSSVCKLPYSDLKHSLLFVAARELWVMSENTKKLRFMGTNYISDDYFQNRLSFLTNTLQKK